MFVSELNNQLNMDKISNTQELVCLIKKWAKKKANWQGDKLILRLGFGTIQKLMITLL